jgi:TM2 domain-containing membrane protein YozV
MNGLHRFRLLAGVLGLMSLLLGLTSGPSFAAQIDQLDDHSQVVNGQSSTTLSLVRRGLPSGDPSPLLIDARSSGGTSQADIDPAGPWQLHASWSCSDSGGAFALQVRGAGGGPVDRISGSGTRDAIRDYPGGQPYHLDIRSSCPWHLVIENR